MDVERNAEVRPQVIGDNIVLSSNQNSGSSNTVVLLSKELLPVVDQDKTTVRLPAPSELYFDSVRKESKSETTDKNVTNISLKKDTSAIPSGKITENSLLTDADEKNRGATEFTCPESRTEIVKNNILENNDKVDRNPAGGRMSAYLRTKMAEAASVLASREDEQPDMTILTPSNPSDESSVMHFDRQAEYTGTLGLELHSTGLIGGKDDRFSTAEVTNDALFKKQELRKNLIADDKDGVSTKNNALVEIKNGPLQMSPTCSALHIESVQKTLPVSSIAGASDLEKRNVENYSTRFQKHFQHVHNAERQVPTGREKVGTKRNATDSFYGGIDGITPAIGSKRKANPCNVSLYRFVRALKSMIVNSLLQDEKEPNQKIDVISNYERNCRAIFVDNEEIRGISKFDRNKKAAFFEEQQTFEIDRLYEGSTSEERARILARIISHAFLICETNGFNLLFSREHLKYFLATHKRYVGIDDFKHVNQIDLDFYNAPNINARSVSKQTFGAASSRVENVNNSIGANNKSSSGRNINKKGILKTARSNILIEYLRSPRNFANSFSRCEEDDVEALQFIVQNDLNLPRDWYEGMYLNENDPQKNLNNRFPFYKTDADSTRIMDGYRKIAINDKERALIYLSPNCVLTLKGHRFVLPHPNICREFSEETLQLLSSNGIDYMFVEILTPKTLVIDLLYVSVSSTKVKWANEHVEYLVQKFSCLSHDERLECARWLLPEMLIVEDFQSNDYDGNYIRKFSGPTGNESYIFRRPNHNMAAIGMQRNNILLACFDDDETRLIYKVNVPIFGSIAQLFGVVPLNFQRAALRNCDNDIKEEIRTIGTLLPQIELNGKLVKIQNLKQSDLIDPSVWIGQNVYCAANTDKIALFETAILVEYKESFVSIKDQEKIISAPSTAKLVREVDRKPYENSSTDEKKTPSGTIPTDRVMAYIEDPRSRNQLLDLLVKSAGGEDFLRNLQERFAKENLPNELNLGF